MNKNKIAVETYNKIAKVYTREFFDDKIDIQYLDKFLSFLSKGARILDVGCGPGQFTKYFLEKGFVAEGVDLSTEMIKIAKKIIPKDIFKIMDMRKLEYPDESFDGLCVAYSLYHIPSEQTSDVLKEFYRVMKPKGVIILMLQEGRKEGIIQEPLNPKLKMFFRYFQKKEIRNLLQKSGFKVVYEATRKPRGGFELNIPKLFVIAMKKTTN